MISNPLGCELHHALISLHLIMNLFPQHAAEPCHKFMIT